MGKIQFIKPEYDLYNLERHLIDTDLALDSYIIDKSRNPILGSGDMDSTFERFIEFHNGSRTFVSYEPNVIIFFRFNKNRSGGHKRMD